MLSVVLFNLIVAIFTDTFYELKETKKAEDIRMLNEVIMDVEYFTFYLFRHFPCLRSYSLQEVNAKKGTLEKELKSYNSNPLLPTYSHLIYAQYQNMIDAEDEDDVVQMVTDLNIKVDKVRDKLEE